MYRLERVGEKEHTYEALHIVKPRDCFHIPCLVTRAVVEKIGLMKNLKRIGYFQTLQLLPNIPCCSRQSTSTVQTPFPCLSMRPYPNIMSCNPSTTLSFWLDANHLVLSSSISASSSASTPSISLFLITTFSRISICPFSRRSRRARSTKINWP